MNATQGLPEGEISVAAYYVWEQQNDYETLCWLLAERELYVKNQFRKPSQQMIKQRAEQIYNASPPYDMLCWLIGKYNLFIKKKEQIEDLHSIFMD